MDLTDEQKDIILRRGSEAQAFIHSPLFLAVKEWVEQEERLMGVVIALDRRDETQKNLTREQFIEQMSGYYRGIQTVLALFQGFISKATDLQKRLDEENAQQAEKEAQKSKMAELEQKAYGPKDSNKK